MKIINRGLDDTLFGEIVEKQTISPYYRLLGFEIVELGSGRAVLEMQANKDFLNGLGIIHGGATAGLCDTVMGVAAMTVGAVPTTVDMKINYLLPAELGSKITGVGKVIKAGKNLVVAEGKIFQEDKCIAASLGTYFDMRVIGVADYSNN